MKIFIDTADLEEIRESLSWGIVNGVTTNPTLIKTAIQKQKEKGPHIPLHSYIRAIIDSAGKNRPVNLEVIGLRQQEMYNQAKTLHEKFNNSANNVVIKIPVNPALTAEDNNHYDGLKVIKRLHSQGIRTNATLIFTPGQALLAAKAGADFISPFAGRIDDFLREDIDQEYTKDSYYSSIGFLNGEEKTLIHDQGIVSGVELVRCCVNILRRHKMKTQVIAASMRNSRQVRECAIVGAHISTVPFDVLKQMITHPKTYEGVKKFSEDVVEEYKELF